MTWWNTPQSQRSPRKPVIGRTYRRTASSWLDPDPDEKDVIQVRTITSIEDDGGIFFKDENGFQGFCDQSGWDQWISWTEPVKS